MNSSQCAHISSTQTVPPPQDTYKLVVTFALLAEHLDEAQYCVVNVQTAVLVALPCENRRCKMDSVSSAPLQPAPPPGLPKTHLAREVVRVGGNVDSETTCGRWCVR